MPNNSTSSSSSSPSVTVHLDSAVKLEITWLNVFAGFSLLLLDICASSYFNLGISKDLLIAAARCIGQLSLLGLILKGVFEAQSPIGVAALSLAMLLLGANEVTFNRSKRRTKGLVCVLFLRFCAQERSCLRLPYVTLVSFYRSIPCYLGYTSYYRWSKVCNCQESILVSLKFP